MTTILGDDNVFKNLQKIVKSIKQTSLKKKKYASSIKKISNIIFLLIKKWIHKINTISQIFHNPRHIKILKVIKMVN